MNTGFGFTEILLIITLILVFFGSKQLPGFLREFAKFTAKVRRYSDRIKRELDDVVRSTEPQEVPFEEQKSQKKELRKKYIAARRALTDREREEQSEAIMHHLLGHEKVKDAQMVMVYVDMGAEVQTRALIRELLVQGKRVAVPYCKEDANVLGVAEITDVDNDIIVGAMQVPEPREALRRTFFKSDLQVIVCPGVAFDRNGGRLGRGKGYYDTFLQELRGLLPVIGLAYSCQILEDSVPFEYHDVAMDVVITEEGPVFSAPSLSSEHDTVSPAG